MRRCAGRLAAAVLVPLLMTACAAVPHGAPGRAVDPAAVQAFQLDGRFNLRVQRGAYPGRVRWQHARNADELWFYSPVGTAVAHLRQDASGALLVTSEGREYRADDLHGLTYDVLGWDLPLGGLQYWVRGLRWPAGGAGVEDLDGEGRLKRLTQAGWQVSYLDWSPAGVAGLPSKLEVQGERLRMRLVVERWSVDGLAP